MKIVFVRGLENFCLHEVIMLKFLGNCQCKKPEIHTKRWAPALFSRFPARKGEVNKERGIGSAKKNDRGKRKSGRKMKKA
jgi:hypothetical protein